MIVNLKIDPRTKLVIVLLLSTAALIYNDIFVLVTVLFTSTAISIAMKSSLISIIVRIRKLIGVMIAIAIVQSLVIKSGNSIIEFKNIVLLTDYGMFKSLEFILRLSIIIISASIITTSTSREIIQGLVQWKCPYEIAFMVSVAIRFLPIFKEEMTDMVTAIQLRGIELNRVRLSQKLMVYKYILMPIIVNSILKAKELSAAMEMRGFRAYEARTSYMILKMQKHDYLIIGICAVSALLFNVGV